MAPLYYRNAKAAVVVFDVTDEKSFRKARAWVDELKKHVPSDISMLIAANKIDMLKDHGGEYAVPAVSNEELEDYAKETGAHLCYTSAKQNSGVDELFQSVARRLLKNHLKEKENELLRRRSHRDHRKSSQETTYMHKRDSSFEKRISSLRENSTSTQGCCR